MFVEHFKLFMTVIVVFLTYCLLKQTIEQSKAATDAVKVAFTQIDSTTQNTRKQLRAYLSISNPEFDPYPVKIKTATGYKTVVTPRVKHSVNNSGQTPALNVSDVTYFEFLPCYPEIVTQTDTSKYTSIALETILE